MRQKLMLPLFLQFLSGETSETCLTYLLSILNATCLYYGIGAVRIMEDGKASIPYDKKLSEGGLPRVLPPLLLFSSGETSKTLHIYYLF